ncbi:20273_t:CDS:2, partial [Rhizophagus irregularis]
MSGKTEISPIIKGVHSQIADTMSEIFFDNTKMALANFIENGFLQTMFSKWNAYKMALYNNEQEALGLSDLDDLDDSAKD